MTCLVCTHNLVSGTDTPQAAVALGIAIAQKQSVVGQLEAPQGRGSGWRCEGVPMADLSGTLLCNNPPRRVWGQGAGRAIA